MKSVCWITNAFLVGGWKTTQLQNMRVRQSWIISLMFGVKIEYIWNKTDLEMGFPLKGSTISSHFLGAFFQDVPQLKACQVPRSPPNLSADRP